MLATFTAGHRVLADSIAVEQLGQRIIESPIQHRVSGRGREIRGSPQTMRVPSLRDEA